MDEEDELQAEYEEDEHTLRRMRYAYGDEYEYAILYDEEES
jgi:hypothetical protein